MKTDLLDFHLPESLIAAHPTEERAASRLLHYRRETGGTGGTGGIGHRVFSELPDLLRRGDLLVFNNARVTPARLALRKETGGRVEGLFVEDHGSPGVGDSGREWSVLLKNLGPVKEGAGLVLEGGGGEAIGVTLLERKGEGMWRVRVYSGEPAVSLLERVGRMPLPPYILKARKGTGEDEEAGADGGGEALDRERYQTVYAAVPGSVAAPTAGLHFTEAVLERLRSVGVERCEVTLHVGIGTFRPVSAETLEEHRMHVERYSLGEDAAEAINRAKAEGRRVIAVGTTSARVLESQAEGPIFPTTGETDIFIRPGYRWKHMSGLITNFHLPRSTLIALVAAWVGMEGQRQIYSEAIRMGYRFYSYGDSSLLE